MHDGIEEKRKENVYLHSSLMDWRSEVVRNETPPRSHERMWWMALL